MLLPLGAAVVAVIVAVVAFLLVGDDADLAEGPGAEAPTEEQVSEFTGSGDETTNEFIVEGRWEIRWETEGETFEVTLVEEDGEPVETVVEHEGPGGGSTYPASDGTHSLEITSDGDWSIRIFEHDD